jgi:tetratricopeptide (TPR) repeat protein
MRLKLLFFFLTFFISMQISSAQDQVKIDSLKIKLDNSTVDTSKISLLTKISDIYARSNYVEAVSYAKLALDISKKSNNKKLISRSYRIVGSRLIMAGIYDEALKYFLESIKIAQEISDEIEQFQTYHNLGVLNDRLAKFDEALTYYFKALGLFEKNINSSELKNEKRLYPVIYNSIGNIYSSKGDPKTCEEYYLKAYNKAVESNNLDALGVVCNNLGKLNLEQENYPKAIEYLNKSLETREKINDQPGIAKTYVFIALYYQTIKQPQKGLEYSLKALEVSKKVKALLTSQNASSLTSEIYERLKDYDKALEYYKLYKSLNDSLINNRKINEITRLQFQYEYDIVNKEKEASDQRKRLVMIILSSTLFLSLIIMGLLFILAKSRNRRIQLENEKLEKEMMLKNKELTTNVMYLLKKNELIENITERLLKLKGKLREENVEAIQRIIFDLQSITEKEVWEEFEYRFQNVHEEFYQNLQKKFPDLSPSEIKLAAFLRLNMTTKEISSITGQSINSLETARYRLRKKLGITNQEVNLVNFLLNI